MTPRPQVLRAFIPFAHEESGIRSELTDESLAAVDEWEPEYQQLIRTPRLQGPLALLDRMGVLGEEEKRARLAQDPDADESAAE